MMIDKAKLVLTLVALRLPGGLRGAFLRRLRGWDIDSSARVGWSLIDAEVVKIARGASIGHFTVIRGLHTLSIGENASVGQWNWISAAQELVLEDEGKFIVGEQAAVTSRHYIDCSGNVSIGAYSTIAGVRTTILSHQIDVVDNRQTCLPVTVGDYCFIGSDARITPGSSIADRVVLAMGGIVVKDLSEPNCLYGGVPARLLKRLDGAAYFDRATGRVER